MRSRTSAMIAPNSPTWAGRRRTRPGVEHLTILADRGYFSGAEVLACEEAGVTPICPKPLTSGAKAEGRFGKPDFLYDEPSDTYRCPAGETLIKRTTTVENGLVLNRYWSSHCRSCALKPGCTPGNERRVTRWEHEHVVEAMQDRLDRRPDAMRIRRQTVEHVFGTIKDWMGRSHFKMRRLPNVGTEMSLHVPRLQREASHRPARSARAHRRDARLSRERLASAVTASAPTRFHTASVDFCRSAFGRKLAKSRHGHRARSQLSKDFLYPREKSLMRARPADKLT